MGAGKIAGRRGRFPRPGHGLAPAGSGRSQLSRRSGPGTTSAGSGGSVPAGTGLPSPSEGRSNQAIPMRSASRRGRFEGLGLLVLPGAERTRDLGVFRGGVAVDSASTRRNSAEGPVDRALGRRLVPPSEDRLLRRVEARPRGRARRGRARWPRCPGSRGVPGASRISSSIRSAIAFRAQSTRSGVESPSPRRGLGILEVAVDRLGERLDPGDRHVHPPSR